MRVAMSYLSEPLFFENDYAALLVIENKQYFRNAIMQLNNGNKDSMFVFSKNYKPIDYESDCVFIENALSIEVNDRKLITRLNNRIVQYANERHMDKLAEIVQNLYEFGQELCMDMDYDVTFNYEIDAPSLIKYMSFKPRIHEDRTELERLLAIFRLYRAYLGTKIFIVANLYVYFSKEELESLFMQIRKEEIYLLALENIVPQSRNGERLCIVDESLCEIR